jgi:hypothetical protein
MVSFIINNLGFSCDENKVNCPKKFKSCQECLINRLNELGFEVNPETTFLLIDSEEKRIQKERELIWQKFLDLLNIKHIIIMDKESGLSLLNYPVSEVDVNIELLSGFIQANITFSESNKSLRLESANLIRNPFYELQYKDFTILLKNGKYVRICLILDHKPSDQMRLRVEFFLQEFEDRFKERLIKFQETGAFSQDKIIEFIISSFDISLVFPMTLAHAIPPEELENMNDNIIQKAFFNLAKEYLSSKSFFYINTLLNKVKRIVNLNANILLYEIYKLFEKKIIIPMPLENVADSIESLKELDYEKEIKFKPISSILVIDDALKELEKKIETIDEETAKKLIKNLIKRGKASVKSSSYEIAQKEYSKALFIAKEFELQEEINKISELNIELEKKAKQLELDFVLEAGENAERNGDIINAIYHYQKALKILEGFLIYNISDSRIKKLKKKIVKLREEI